MDEGGTWGPVYLRAVRCASVPHSSNALSFWHKLNLRDGEREVVWALSVLGRNIFRGK